MRVSTLRRASQGNNVESLVRRPISQCLPTMKIRRPGESPAQRVSFITVLMATGLLVGCASQELPRPDPAEVIRSRMAQVVDADTGRPIEGAMVLEVFYLSPKRGFGNFPVPKVFRDSAEALTDRDGRFSLTGPFDSRSWWIDGLYIFKPGYGPWRFQADSALTPTATTEAYWAWLQQTWDRFTTSGVVIELRPLRTREERLKYMDEGWDAAEAVGARYSRSTPFTPRYFFDVPADRLEHFQAFVNQERANLDLPPRQLDGNRQPE
jgi:hypothetical protein